ncbi:MAG: PadR family transcriptional regulator [Nocardioidaceae bacterium]
MNSSSQRTFRRGDSSAPRSARSSRVGTLGYAILGLLATKHRTGYDLAQQMKTPIGYMWTAQHSQIYPQLARLEAESLVRSSVIAGRGPRDTKLYTITPAGRDALRTWVDSPLIEVTRSEFMLRVRSLWLLSPDRARAFIAEQRERCQQRLDSYLDEGTSFSAQTLEVADPTTAAFAAFATLQYGIMRVRDTIAWCDWMLDQLDDAQLGQR